MTEDLTKVKRLIGKEIKLGEIIGTGGNGDVYLAQPLKTTGQYNYPKTFVVKVIRKEICSPEYIATIHRELETLKKLSHPFIVEYIASWVESGKNNYNGCYCLATNYCSGGDLHTLICSYITKRNQPPEDLVVKLMAQVFSALNYSHSRKIIHRDMKPGNVFVVKDESKKEVERVVVGDFGLARPLDKTCQVIQTRVGTPCYCSPEIVAAEPYTYKTDIFSTGVMFYELMTLERPFWKKEYTDRQVFKAILNVDPIPRLETLCKSKYNAGLLRIVTHCLEKHEKSRPTAYEVLCTLSSHLTRYVRVNNIPVFVPAGSVSPVRATSPQKNPTSPCKSKSPRKSSVTEAKKGEVKVGVADVSADLNMDKGVTEEHRDPLVSPTKEGNVNTAARLMTFLQKEFPSDLDLPLFTILEQNAELFSLVKVLSITRGGDLNSMENAIFKVLLTLSPSAPVQKTVEIVSQNFHTTEG